MTTVIAASKSLQVKNINDEEIINQVISVFQDGVDFATIAGCKKPTLLVPGADKFCFKFGLSARSKVDEETQNIFKDVKNLVVYKCELMDIRTGKILGEGRGAAQLGDGQNCRTYNSMIKMAEVRAKRDAVLNTFPIRDRFTQDMDDEPLRKNLKIKDDIITINEI